MVRTRGWGRCCLRFYIYAGSCGTWEAMGRISMSSVRGAGRALEGDAIDCTYGNDGEGKSREDGKRLA